MSVGLPPSSLSLDGGREYLKIDGQVVKFHTCFPISSDGIMIYEYVGLLLEDFRKSSEPTKIPTTIIISHS